MPPRGLQPAVARLAAGVAAGRWWQQLPTAALDTPFRRGVAQSPPKPDKPAAGASLDPPGRAAAPPIEAPRSYGRRVEGGFTPKPLPRPIGMPLPPKAGENTGIDRRTLKERRDNFVDYDKHLQRRKELTAQISRPYFRDWGNMQLHDGKSFIAPPCLFRADVSLFFPNLYGEPILASDRAPRDTTPLLTGKVSVVAIFSCQWAERQVASFASREANPALHDFLARNDDVGQLVHVNYEDNAAKAWLVRLFRRSLRKKLPEKDWGNYLLVRRGITDDIRESIGLLNAKVGYTYIVDEHCRIRWAGSGSSHPDERNALTRGFVRLVDELRKGRPAVTAQQRLSGTSPVKSRVS